MNACTLSGPQSVLLRGLFVERLDEQQSITPHIWRPGNKTIPRYHPDAEAFKGYSLLSLPVMTDYLFIHVFYHFFIAFDFQRTLWLSCSFLRRSARISFFDGASIFQSRRIIPFASHYRTINANDLVHIHELTLRNLQFHSTLKSTNLRAAGK